MLFHVSEKPAVEVPLLLEDTPAEDGYHDPF
jgi:hypothetical protein